MRFQIRRAMTVPLVFIDAAEDFPVAVGGVGGSGTRLVAMLLQEMGFHLGSDLHPSVDTRWFTLLFKRREILRCDDTEIGQLAVALRSGLAGGHPLPADIVDLVWQLTKDDRLQHSAPWLHDRARSLIGAAAEPMRPGRWGWKEPNTHVIIDRLWQHMPTLRYVHVVRHGLDMAYSRNQNQVLFWEGVAAGTKVTPPQSFAYWCKVHRRMQQLLAANADRMFWLDYDALCRDPDRVLPGLCDFLGVQVPTGFRIEDMVKPQPHRYQPQQLDQFAPDDLAFVRSLGYAIEASDSAADLQGRQ